MRPCTSSPPRPLQLLLLAVALAALFGLLAPAGASAAVSCPNANPVLNENNCTGAGTRAYDMTNYSDNVGGFSTRTSFNLGQDVPLKIGRNQLPGSRVNIAVYRMGYYGGTGGRLISAAGANSVVVNNNFTCNPQDPTTGKLDCGNWAVTYTIPGAALPASGIYVAKLTTTDNGIQNQIVFVVRDDNRVPESRVLFVLPTASYQAYNNWGGKSLYFDSLGTGNTVAGDQRAVKVSFNRPLDKAESSRNRFFGPDEAMVYWLEQQGYDVSYTDDLQADSDGAELKQHKVLLVSGHSEYWSGGEMANFKAARDAGVNIASFSGNTAYWKVRYEDNGRTLVCYKTVEGSGAGGSGTVSANDWGPDGVQGTADDALGADGIAGTADDHPENSTTTWRDNGAPPGDPNAPPGGRVGPDQPENSLFGNMYVGDNEATNWPLRVPAGNAAGEFAADRIWRNTGISQNSTTSIGDLTVGWEWDAIPAQQQYLAKQPAGVKRVSLTDVSATDSSWIQDEGRLRANVPPPGQPSAVSAVKYRAASGAWVFAAGTNLWAEELSDPRLSQATYNILSDEGVQPATPTGITTDPAGSNQAPIAAFGFSPSPAKLNQSVTFDASGSSDPDGTIARYEWDLDGNGTYERTTTTPVTTTTYTAEGDVDVHLRVTDNGGGTDLTTRTVTVIGNLPPTASFTVAPNPAVVSQTVTFDGSGSSDQDGTIAKYEWDLDGNGTYETNAGTTPTATKAFSAAGTVNVGLRVTDNGGKTATATMPVTVNSGGVSDYGDTVLVTPGLTNYWRMGEAAGPTLADSKGTAPATVTGGTFGVPGGPAFDPNTAVGFNGLTDFGKTTLDLSSKTAITVEFWLKWTSYANNDALAMEFTPNFNQNAGGFIVDPNAPQQGGQFAVAIGIDGSRNNVFFARPSAGAWHHYAMVIDTTAPAATQITPYVDGKAVSYTKGSSGTGAGTFASSDLYLMSRAGTSLFGAGALDELAVYGRALDAGTIADHFNSYGTNRRPTAAFSITPNPARTGQTVTFDGSASSDPDGTIQKYEWDLNGDGAFDTTTTSPTVTRTYNTEQSLTIKLRVTDNSFGTETTTKSFFVGNAPPTATFTATPNPALVDQAVKLDATSASDPDGSIVKYEWDLDGNGTFETDTGTTATTTRKFSATGTYNVGLRTTDNEGKTTTATIPVTVNSQGTSDYGDAVLRTDGVLHYYRMGETGGPSIADSKGTATGTIAGGTFAVPGAVKNDPNTAIRFNGTSDSGSVPMDLSSASTLTVEFWLKWKAYANDDALAMEFTPNFNQNAGGFLVDPNAPQANGSFGVGFGSGNSRNNVFFARPSAGAWHHYAFVLDAPAPAATQITPYVDGQAVSYSKGDSGTGAGPFANSTLYLMSRAGSALFGAGDLDEVAIYKGALSADTVRTHFTASGTNKRPVASFTASTTTPQLNQSVTFDASASSDPDGQIVDYQWDLDGNGTYETDTGTTPTATKAYAAEGTVNVALRVIDNQNSSDTASKTLTVGNGAPTASFTATPATPVVGQTVQLDASASSDPDGSIAQYEWDLDGNGTYERTTTTPATSTSYGAAGAVTVGLRVTDNGGRTATTTRTVTVKTTSYASLVLATPELSNYWRMGEASGTTLADSKGTSPATLVGGLLGVTGALGGDADTAARFNGNSNYARALLDLSSTQTLTVEFWLKWNSFASDDDLAMEFTPNFNQNGGGFLVDPNAGSQFGIGFGVDASRNNAYFARPSAGAWHHYAFVLDATAPAATQITPYVDGQPVAYTKGASGTGAGPFANSTLYFMSRAGAALFGAGDLDEVAIYKGALTAQAIANHYAAGQP